ncbi:TetR family transcriptional regulator [Azoarcus sp. TTM-91]|uniref:TetR/AcrR family transcriptional regulator n=1 Tax=Azoarcus sp. TTM-91 TaxID=2691581 RepID=UPI00145C5A32|nr:TetR/AcrR family transcriptional regulator [Azoarcus sp. TTM-91]NMG33704.1 TetR family transcriptional regulator [Azoarcus sp. TTM-91]
MSADSATPADQPRAEARRAQILAAASDCFHAHGFHGSSISQISKAAGMSAGHIYHYFENKEAIIAAIVEQDIERLQEMTDDMRAAENPLEAMMESIDAAVAEHMQPDHAPLKLEIVAEAGRNPHIAAAVHAADAKIMGAFEETIGLIRRAGGHQDDSREIRGRTEIISALFEGLIARSIRNPAIDKETTLRIFRQIVRDLLQR